MKNIVLALLLIPLIVSCDGRSTLSDVELTDETLISPEIQLKVVSDESTRKKHSLEVVLRDKQNNGIELKKGEVRLNGTLLSVGNGNNDFGSIPTYSLDHFKVNENNRYNIEITLADDQTYSCKVVSPKYLIEDIKVNQYHNYKNDMKIGLPFRHSPGVTYELYLENEKSNDRVSIDIDNGDVKQGYVILPSFKIKKIIDGERVDGKLTLIATKAGKVQSNFNGGSIQVIQEIHKQITFDLNTEDLSFEENDNSIEDYDPEKPEDNTNKFNWWVVILTLFGGGFIGFFISKMFKNKQD
jgi:hypothetical protein